MSVKPNHLTVGDGKGKQLHVLVLNYPIGNEDDVWKCVREIREISDGGEYNKWLEGGKRYGMGFDFATKEWFTYVTEKQ